MNKSKSIWLPMMLLVLLVHIFSNGLVILHYKLNQKFITEKFCENKAKPKMQCNGKCHIKKTLTQLNGSKEKSNSYELEFSQYIIADSFLTPTISQKTIINNYHSIDSQNENIGYLSNIFHPPLI
jgi:hypothetical protein